MEFGRLFTLRSIQHCSFPPSHRKQGEETSGNEKFSCKRLAPALLLPVMKSCSDQLDDLHRSQGLRSTSARRNVFVAIQQAASPLSAAQVDAALNSAGTGIDLVTIYRTLETLERCGLIVKTERLKEGWRYAIRTQQHHHNIVCSICGSASPLEQCQLARLERTLAQSTGFSNIRHSLQFFGTCPDCQPAETETP